MTGASDINKDIHNHYTTGRIWQEPSILPSSFLTFHDRSRFGKRDSSTLKRLGFRVVFAVTKLAPSQPGEADYLYHGMDPRSGNSRGFLVTSLKLENEYFPSILYVTGRLRARVLISVEI